MSDDEDVLDELDDDVDEYDGPQCVGCGCTDDHPCEGGCIWATPDLCSRCV